MSNQKSISIVIPVFNRERIVLRTLECIALQDTRDFTLIIVDNNSTDESLSVVSSWAKRNPDIDCIILSETKPGAAAARNCGLRHVTTEHVLFFDSDDYMAHNHISSAISLIKSNPEADVFGWEGLQEQKDGKMKTARFSVQNPLREHLIFATLATFRYAIRTDLIRKVGAWNEDLRTWDDYELGVRILLENPIIVKRPGKPLVKSFFSEISYTANAFSANTAMYEKPLNLIEVYLKDKRPDLLPWIDYRRAVLAAFYAMEDDAQNAARLLKQASSGKTPTWIVKTLYFWHLNVKTGAWIIARTLFPIFIHK